MKITKIKPLICSVSCTLLFSLLYNKSYAATDYAEFDQAILNERGLDSALGTYFSHAAKYLPGRKPVDLYINGNGRGSVTARFGQSGELCIDKDFLASAGLTIPAEIAHESSSEENSAEDAVIARDKLPCHDYKEYYPDAVITPRPGEERLDLLVPPTALSRENDAGLNYQRGGTAGLFNYDLYSTKNSYSDDSHTYSQASLEEGFNINDWLWRSRQILTKNDNDFTTENIYNYAQHTLVDQKAIVQVGQIYINNTLFSGSAINGAQIIPEGALTGSSASGVTVQGIARGPQARVEIRQNGALIYSTLVPVGPFSLEDVPITSVNSALDVKVVETDGSENHYVIPAEAVRPSQLGGPQGLSIAAGRLRDIETDESSPYLLTATKGWKATEWMNIAAGGMVATKYNALGLSADIAPLSALMFSVVMKGSQDERNDKRGSSSTLGANYSVNEHLYFNASATNYSSGYRELTDTLQDDFSQYSEQYSAGVGWGNTTLGSVNLSYSLSKSRDDEGDSRYLMLSWGKTFSRFSVSVNWQSQLSHTNSEYNHGNDGDMLYVNLSIPFGSQRVSFYYRKQGTSEHAGLQSSGNLTSELSYTVSTERDMYNQENSYDASLSDNLHFAQLGLNVGADGKDSRNYGATLRGGVLMHSKGVTFSPYAIEDTFALAELGEKVSNVQISTPAGDVWTDRWGRAVIPSLMPYRNSRIEINTESLPKNIDVNNGISTVALGHGAVSKLHFGVINTRRIMLHISGTAGKTLMKGSSIVDGQGNYIATVIDNGLVFISDASNLTTLYAMDENGKRQCQLHFTLPKQQDLNNFFEDINGVCQ